MTFLLFSLLMVSPQTQTLEHLQKFYTQAGDFSAHFTQTYVEQLRNKKREEQGTVFIANNGKVRWTYEKPEHKEFIYDGKNAYFYEPSNAQVTVFENFADSQLSTVIQFLWGKGDVQKHFTIMACDTLCSLGTNPDTVIELIPKEPIASVKRLALIIAPNGKLQKTVMFDALGNQNIYQFENFQLHLALKPEKFNFKMPSGVSVLKADSFKKN